MIVDTARRPRPDGTPPRFTDPRRYGALIGLVGACVFVFSYTSGSTGGAAIGARILVLALVATTLCFLFVAPRPLGPFVPARGWQIGVYVLCVIAEVAVIAVGSRLLGAAGVAELRPALIALVVGVHFLPFAWAFKERMFYTLGGTLILLGGAGLLIGTSTSALVAAVVSGLAMACLVLAYSLGAFAPRKGA
jgi:hypothetical protein